MWSSLSSQEPHKDERRRWLDRAHSQIRAEYSAIRLSSHALLLIDIERAFCAGAWLAVVTLSHASVEATLRQILYEDYDSSAVELFGKVEDLHWLRAIRNEILHASEPGTPSKIWKHSSDDLPACHAALEPEAKRAVELAYRALYVGAEA